MPANAAGGEERGMTAAQPLYRQVMGPEFDRMPIAVRTLHGATVGVRAHGRCDIRRGRNVLSRILGRWLGVPSQAEGVELQFEIAVRDGVEEWKRRFGQEVMRSRFWVEDGVLHERLGPVVMTHVLENRGDGLHTRLLHLFFLGIPVPRVLYPRIRAVASQEGELYRFDVSAELPMVGLIVGYRGGLKVAGPGLPS